MIHCLPAGLRTNMVNEKDNADTRQVRWARFRFSIIEPLLSAPPEVGQLQSVLLELSHKQWRHPITGLPMSIGVSKYMSTLIN
jgi:hypothetical protein